MREGIGEIGSLRDASQTELRPCSGVIPDLSPTPAFSRQLLI